MHARFGLGIEVCGWAFGGLKGLGIVDVAGVVKTLKRVDLFCFRCGVGVRVKG